MKKISDVKKKLEKIESGKISNLKLLYRFVRKDGKIIWLREQIKTEMIDGRQTFKRICNRCN